MFRSPVPIKKKLVLLFLMAIAICLPRTVYAAAEDKKPEIRDLALHQGEEHVLLSAVLETGMQAEALEALKGGIPLTFRFKVRLTRKGSFLGEKLVRSQELTHTLQYNPVKQFYTFEGEGYDEFIEVTVKDEQEALKLLTGIDNWPLYQLDELEDGVRYRVRVMATLRSAELPSVFGYIFFFTTIFNRETAWSQLDFTY
jgi:hypothetical protein